MIDNDAFVQTICGALEQAGVKLMYDAATVVRDNLSVEYTRGGKTKIVGYGKSCVDRKSTTLATEVVATFSADLVKTAHDDYYMHVVESFADVAEAKLLADLTAQGIEFKVQTQYGGRRNHKADEHVGRYRVETNHVSYTTTSLYHTKPLTVTCHIMCMLPFLKP